MPDYEYLCPLIFIKNMNFILTCGETKIEVSEKELSLIPVTKTSANQYCINYLNKNYSFYVEKLDVHGKEVELKTLKRKKNIKIEDPIQQVIKSLGYNSARAKQLDSLNAPMPGLVLEVLVKEGEEVKKGDRLLILEAMKMENVLKATHDGTIKKINVSKGEKVEKNQQLILFS
jgi:biotin carboxyl carrier protein